MRVPHLVAYRKTGKRGYIRMMRVVALTVFALICPRTAWSQMAIPYVVVFDSYMTPAAGAQDLVTVQHLLASAEDRWLPLKIGDERNRRGLALGIFYRSGKFLALDMPQDHFLLVVAHEVFGHGARFRELGEGTLRYGFDAPIPYGAGGAFTRFNGAFPISPLADMNVSAAGIEAQHSLADAIAERAVARGRIHYREGWLYFEARMAAVDYILSASPTSSEGHDAASFLETFEKACIRPCSPITRNQIQRRSLLALADPLLYYSIYGLAVSYVGNGSTTGPMPLVPLGGELRVMPSLGYAMAPYGAEWTVRAAFQQQQRAQRRERRLTGVTLRVGDTGASSTWGIGARLADVVRVRGLRIALAVELWRQPELLADRTSDAQHTGGSAVGTVILPLPRMLRSQWSDGIQISAGYKSEGFVPGEQLSGGAVVRAGVVFAR
jgi:hypothetical protein